MQPPNQGLRQQYTFTDFCYYIGLLAVPVLTAGLAIGRHSLLGLLGYLILGAGATSLVLKFYCSRCPHYAHPGHRLRCMFFWNLPKFFPARPGALNRVDLWVTWSCPILMFTYPLIWLVREPGLLLVYLLSAVGFAATVRRYECHRCRYFDCPLNSVPPTRLGDHAEGPPPSL